MFYDEVALEKKLTRRLKNVRRLERKLIRIKSGLSRLVILHRIDLRVWEMDAKQLWETTMDPENRILVQVHIDDAEKLMRCLRS